MVQYVDTTDGVRLAYEVAGTGQPGLLFAHGWCGDRSYFAPQFAHFAACRTVATLDLRGHGDSGRPEPGPGVYDVETLATDLLTVARAAGLDRPVVVGHSLGGLAALVCAARPGAVRAAVLVEPAPIFPGARKEYFMNSVPDVAGDHDGSWRRNFFTGLLKPADTARRDEIMAAAGAQPAPISAAVLHAMGSFDGTEHMNRVAVPLLAITAGAGEPGLRDGRVATIGRTIGAGHFNQLEVPDQVNAMIERFLAVNDLMPAT